MMPSGPRATLRRAASSVTMLKTASDAARRFLQLEAGGHEVARLLRRPVVPDERVARGEQAASEAAPHRPQPDETERCHHFLRTISPLASRVSRLRRAVRAAARTPAISPLASRVPRLRRAVRAAARTSAISP